VSLPNVPLHRFARDVRHTESLSGGVADVDAVWRSGPAGRELFVKASPDGSLGASLFMPIFDKFTQVHEFFDASAVCKQTVEGGSLPPGLGVIQSGAHTAGAVKAEKITGCHFLAYPTADMPMQDFNDLVNSLLTEVCTLPDMEGAAEADDFNYSDDAVAEGACATRSVWRSAR
jgi:hypothetical protein